jgi:MFS family permease
VGAARPEGTILRPLAPTLALTGVLALGLGMIDVAAPVSAIVADERDLAGVLLAVWAVGSLLGGLALAGRLPQVAPLRRASLFVLGAAVAAGSCALAPSLPVLGAVLAVNGFFIAPSLAALYEQVAVASPVERRTEAFGLLVSVLLVTAALGTAVAGVLAEALTPAAAFAASAAVLAAGALAGVRATRARVQA